MELSQEHKDRIEEIMAGMQCPRGFKCREHSFTDFPKIQRVGTLLECHEVSIKNCYFAMPFGYGRFCRCPLLAYVKKIKKQTVL